LKDIAISHRIEILPNNKAKTYFKKAFGCARFAWNWILARWRNNYKNGIYENRFEMQKAFNEAKEEEFPFVYEVTKYATQAPFRNFEETEKKFYKGLKKGEFNYPQFKSKKDGHFSFYIGGDQVRLCDYNKNSRNIPSGNKQYLDIPKLGCVKMKERLRFKGKINSVTISMRDGGKYFASFSMTLSQEEYDRTHKKEENKNLGVGIDVGISSFATMSNGIKVEAPKPLEKSLRQLKKLNRQSAKKQHPKTKGEKRRGVKCSNNYKKHAQKIQKLYAKISNQRKDFLHKLSTCMVSQFDYICAENLDVKEMLKNKRLARKVSDMSFYEFTRQLDYKTQYADKQLIRVDQYFPSSKKCSNCGSIKEDLTLQQRTYICDACGLKIDRDYNASLNLYNELKQQLGKVLPEVTPADLTAMLSRFEINGLVTSKVEPGIQ
jgi:putative transposase